MKDFIMIICLAIIMLPLIILTWTMLVMEIREYQKYKEESVKKKYAKGEK